jgi:CRISPR-associated protein Csb2
VLRIDVELLHGTYRAGSAGDLALTGRLDPGEWPPSPARLFAALVAGAGTGDRMECTDGTELAVLEAAGAPCIVADPLTDVAFSELRPRYVVVDDKAENTAQEYPARTSTEVRPSPRACPRHPEVSYVWSDLTMDAAHVAALRFRAARVGYLGCADTPVRLSVSTSGSAPDGSGAWVPDPEGAAAVPVPFPGMVEVLDAAYEQFTAGTTIRRSWYRSEQAWYRPPGDEPPRSEVEPIVLWLRFERPIPGRRLLALTETLRSALLERYTRHVAGRPDAVPSVIHGHHDRGGAHLRLLALPDVGYRHSRGRIHGAAVAIPPSTDPKIVDGVRTALWHLQELVAPGVFRTPVALHGGERRPWAAHPSRWIGPQEGARRWVSAFPVVHERFTRREGPTAGEVAIWCRNAGVDVPVLAVRSARVPLLTGAVSLHPREARRRSWAQRPYSHLDVTFERPVRGPMAIGAGRHFGLGLMVPPPSRGAPS